MYPQRWTKIVKNASNNLVEVCSRVCGQTLEFCFWTLWAVLCPSHKRPMLYQPFNPWSAESFSVVWISKGITVGVAVESGSKVLGCMRGELCRPRFVILQPTTLEKYLCHTFVSAFGVCQTCIIWISSDDAGPIQMLRPRFPGKTSINRGSNLPLIPDFNLTRISGGCCPTGTKNITSHWSLVKKRKPKKVKILQ